LQYPGPDRSGRSDGNIYESPGQPASWTEFIGSVGQSLNGDLRIVEDQRDHRVQRAGSAYLYRHGINHARPGQEDDLRACGPEKVWVSPKKTRTGIQLGAWHTIHDIRLTWAAIPVFYISNWKSGPLVQTFFANSERRLPRMTWEDDVFSLAGMTERRVIATHEQA